jgi:DNA-binding GntR family transcriptional regulator
MSETEVLEEKVVSGRICEEIRAEIVSGRVPEGAPLREVALAERFRVSRGPVREALQQLAHEGLAVAKPNCGMRVASAPPNAIQELIAPMRRSLEVFALRRIFFDLGEEDFASWDRLLEAMREACEANDFARSAELDLEFHQSIVERVGEPDLSAMWTTMVSRLRRHFREGHSSYEEPMKIYHEHVAVVAMFRAGNIEPAVKALEDNIE